MADISIKYSMLNKNAQKEVNDFMDFLLKTENYLIIGKFKIGS